MADVRDIEAEDLIRSLRSGTDDSLNRLMEIFNPSLIGYIRKTVYCDYSDAEDIAQTTWLDLFEKVKSPQYAELYSVEKGSFHTYLTHCIAIYKIRQHFRDNKRRALFFAQPEDDRNEMEQLPDDDSNQPHSLMEAGYSLKLRINAYREAFRLTFLCGGYPHQQLAFAFSKLVKSKQSPRGIEGNASIVYRELKDIPLETLTDMFWEAYRTVSFFEERSMAVFKSFLNPLRSRLGYMIGKLMELDARSLQYYCGIKDRRAGDTNFNDYLSSVLSARGKGTGTVDQKDLSDMVSNWVYKVEKRIRDILGVKKNQPLPEDDDASDPVENAVRMLNDTRVKPGRCGHCPLRMLEPCCSPAAGDA